MVYQTQAWGEGEGNRSLSDGLNHMEAGIQGAHLSVNLASHVPAGWAVGNDATTALTAAIAAAVAAGAGTVMIPFPSIALSGNVTIPEGVGLVGLGGGLNTPGTRIVCTSAGARISVGGRSVASRGGPIGNFMLDGNGVATQPFYVGRAVGRHFLPIAVTGSAGHGVVIEEAQNNQFEMLDSSGNAGTGLVLDRGCGGNLFVKPEFNANLIGLHITETDGTGLSTLVYAQPTHNRFLNPIIERHGAGGCECLVKVDAGVRNTIQDGIAALTTVPSSGSLVLVNAKTAQATTSELILQDSMLFGEGTTTGVTVAGSTGLYCVGRTTLQGLSVGFNVNSAAYGSVDDVRFSAVTTRYSNAGVVALRRTLNRPLQLIAEPSQSALIVTRQAEVGSRARIHEDGTIGWASGADNTFDTVVGRTAANVLGMSTGDSFAVDGTWNGGQIRLGSHRLWVDATGALRIKSSAPASDTDGTVVGTQA